MRAVGPKQCDDDENGKSKVYPELNSHSANEDLANVYRAPEAVDVRASECQVGLSLFDLLVVEVADGNADTSSKKAC